MGDRKRPSSPSRQRPRNQTARIQTGTGDPNCLAVQRRYRPQVEPSSSDDNNSPPHSPDPSASEPDSPPPSASEPDSPPPSPPSRRMRPMRPMRSRKLPGGLNARRVYGEYEAARIAARAAGANSPPLLRVGEHGVIVLNYDPLAPDQELLLHRARHIPGEQPVVIHSESDSETDEQSIARLQRSIQLIREGRARRRKRYLLTNIGRVSLGKFDPADLRYATDEDDEVEVELSWDQEPMPRGGAGGAPPPPPPPPAAAV